ncbi:MAG TPA: ATP-binding protein [Burkholderiaceae bacterium]|nr:ATP-binding protein [Burkholderiaceae bacterium]
MQQIPEVGGDMASRVRAFDWSSTPVGAPERWPQSLRTAVATLLECRLPMYLAWGPGFTQFYNDAYRPILGAKDPDALGNAAPTTWHEIWPTIGPMWERVLAGEAIGFDDFKLTIDRFGYPEDCWFNFSYSPVRDEAGRAVGVLVTFAETTKRVVSERRLRFLDELTQATRALADPEQVMRTTAERLGRHLGVNRCAYAQVLDDQDTFDLIGDYNDGVPSIVGRYRFTDFGAEVRALMVAHEPYVNADVDTDPRTAGGDLSAYRATRIGAVICLPLHKAGRFVAAMAVHQAVPRRWTHDEVELVRTVVDRCWDALERIRADAALRSEARALEVLSAERERLLESERAARREAEKANAVKDQFLSTLSHELRTPLSAISGWVHILRRTVDPSQADVLKGISVIERSTKAQIQLIEDLLDMGRIASGKIHLSMQPVDLAAVVQASVDVIRPTAQAAGLDLRADVEPVGAVAGDASRLQQVMINLLANAVKFTPRGGSVRVELRERPDGARIVVSDDGIGIRPEALPGLFQRFHQVDGEITRKYGGLGLGLSIVRHLVDLHGGSVQAHSEGEGHGASFVVRLPLLAHEPAGPTPSEDAAEWSPPGLAGTAVLVVDDDADARELLERIFRDAGASVVLADRAEAALQRVRERRFDLLVSDIGMPGMDGFELLRRLRQLPRDANGRVPAMALTAFARTEDRRKAEEAGFARYVVKPMAPAEVLRAAAELLTRA